MPHGTQPDATNDADRDPQAGSPDSVADAGSESPEEGAAAMQAAEEATIDPGDK